MISTSNVSLSFSGKKLFEDITGVVYDIILITMNTYTFAERATK